MEVQEQQPSVDLPISQSEADSQKEVVYQLAHPHLAASLGLKNINAENISALASQAQQVILKSQESGEIVGILKGKTLYTCTKTADSAETLHVLNPETTMDHKQIVKERILNKQREQEMRTIVLQDGVLQYQDEAERPATISSPAIQNILNTKVPVVSRVIQTGAGGVPYGDDNQLSSNIAQFVQSTSPPTTISRLLHISDPGHKVTAPVSTVAAARGPDTLQVNPLVSKAVSSSVSGIQAKSDTAGVTVPMSGARIVKMGGQKILYTPQSTPMTLASAATMHSYTQASTPSATVAQSAIPHSAIPQTVLSTGLVLGSGQQNQISTPAAIPSPTSTTSIPSANPDTKSMVQLRAKLTTQDLVNAGIVVSNGRLIIPKDMVITLQGLTGQKEHQGLIIQGVQQGATPHLVVQSAANTQTISQQSGTCTQTVSAGSGAILQAAALQSGVIQQALPVQGGVTPQTITLQGGAQTQVVQSVPLLPSVLKTSAARNVHVQPTIAVGSQQGLVSQAISSTSHSPQVVVSQATQQPEPKVIVQSVIPPQQGFIIPTSHFQQRVAMPNQQAVLLQGGLTQTGLIQQDNSLQSGLVSVQSAQGVNTQTGLAQSGMITPQCRTVTLPSEFSHKGVLTPQGLAALQQLQRNKPGVLYVPQQSPQGGVTVPRSSIPTNLSSQGVVTQWNQPVLTQSGMNQPILTQTGVNQPVLTQMGVNQPILTQTGVNQPILTQTGVNQPTLTQIRVSQPTLTKSRLSQPGLTHTGINQPTLTQTVVNQAELAQTVVNHPGLATQTRLKQPVLTQGLVSHPELAKTPMMPTTLVQSGMSGQQRVQSQPSQLQTVALASQHAQVVSQANQKMYPQVVQTAGLKKTPSKILPKRSYSPYTQRVPARQMSSSTLPQIPPDKLQEILAQLGQDLGVMNSSAPSNVVVGMPAGQSTQTSTEQAGKNVVYYQYNQGQNVHGRSGVDSVHSGPSHVHNIPLNQEISPDQLLTHNVFAANAHDQEAAKVAADLLSVTEELLLTSDDLGGEEVITGSNLGSEEVITESMDEFVTDPASMVVQDFF